MNLDVDLTVSRLFLLPGDTLIIRPTDMHLTPNHARELQDYLRENIDAPGVTVLVLPMPTELTIAHQPPKEE